MHPPFFHMLLNCQLGEPVPAFCYLHPDRGDFFDQVLVALLGGQILRFATVHFQIVGGYYFFVEGTVFFKPFFRYIQVVIRDGKGFFCSFQDFGFPCDAVLKAYTLSLW